MKRNLPSFSNSFLKYWLLALSLILLNGCVGGRFSPDEPGVWYTVQSGDTAESIGKKYKIRLEDLLRRNEIFDPEDISAEMVIFIPGAKKKQESSSEVRFPEMGRRDPVMRSGKRLVWPAKGTISSGFGRRHGKMHEGVDITADGGKKIISAGSGVVEFSGKMRGYGNTLVINHGHGIKTLYAHNARNFVRQGQRVQQGQRIATLGNSGRSTGPHLHFEVKINDKARNPLRYLPLR